MDLLGRKFSRLAVVLVSFLVLVAGFPSTVGSTSESPRAEFAGNGVVHRLSSERMTGVDEPADRPGRDVGRDLNLVFDPDTRIQVTDTTQEPFVKIAHLVIIDEGTGVGQRCTGAFIGPNVLITAAHCIWNPDYDGFPDTVEVLLARNGDQLPFGSAFAGFVWVPAGWIASLSDGDLIPDWDLDYALVVMNDDSLGNAVGPMTIGLLSDAELEAPEFNPMTAGYPGDKQIGTMWLGTEPAFSGVTNTSLFHQIDSVGGQSGSPVWRASDGLVVGIESFETNVANVARRFTQDVIDELTDACADLECSFSVATDIEPPPRGNGENPPPVDRPTDPAFQRTWARTDRPVADGEATRTWMWGPQANTQVVIEPYDDAPEGSRSVQYWDKSRMEITDPNGDSDSIWFVTNGLLATELITGRVQLGDNQFDEREPAAVNVAGDANDPNGPTYATFGVLLGAQTQQVGTPVTQRVDRAGTVSNDPSLAGQGIAIDHVDDVTNHGIAGPFWAFMNSSGVIYQDGQFMNAPLFENAFFATGRPITEPYWANVLVGGTSRLVLMQCFERRCLTYTPDNAPEWRVEMGNIGQHYYAWRYTSNE